MRPLAIERMHWISPGRKYFAFNIKILTKDKNGFYWKYLEDEELDKKFLKKKFYYIVRTCKREHSSLRESDFRFKISLKKFLKKYKTKIENYECYGDNIASIVKFNYKEW